MQPDIRTEVIERLAARAHRQYVQAKLDQGITSRLLEWGEECLVPYDMLSEKAKDLDRAQVIGFLAGLEDEGYTIVRTP